MDVHVGSFQEPDDLPGLAHFLEHMLHLGTHEHPSCDEYANYVTDHGGHGNAHTEDEHTQYTFEIMPDHLEEALDRFSRFFIDPLFNEECVTRELEAIENEFQEKISGWKICHVTKSLCRADHPLARFSMGNMETLKVIPERKGINVRERMIEFYRTFYSANIMKLAVYGKDSLDDLERMVKDRFSNIVNRNVKIPELLGSPIDPEHMQKMVTMKFGGERGLIELRWDLLGVHDCTYQVSLLNKAGPGSLRKYFSEFEWFLSLEASSTTDHRNLTTICIRVALSPPNPEATLVTITIIGAIFDYIKMIKDTRVKKAYHDELLTLHALNFRFKPKPASFDATERIAQNLHHYTPRNILWERQTDEFEPQKIEFITDQLRLDNVVILTTSPVIPEEKVRIETYAKTKFVVNDLPAELIYRVQNPREDLGFKMSRHNRYLLYVSKLKIARRPFKMDNSCLADGPIKFLFVENDSNHPTTAIDIVLTTDRSASSIDHYACTWLFVEMFKLERAYMLRDAQEVNLQFKMSIKPRGIVFSFNGAKEMIFAHLFDVLGGMLKFKPTCETHLRIAKNLIGKELANTFKPDPQSRATSYLDLLLSEASCRPAQLQEKLPDISIDDLTGYGQELFSEGNLHVHHIGGITKGQMFKFQERLMEIFDKMDPFVEVGKLKARVAKLGSGQDFIFYDKINHTQSAVAIYMQTGSSHDIVIRAFTSLFASIIDGPFFNELRTEQQLAYSLSAGLREDNSSTGIVFVAQSKVSPIVLESEIEKFIRGRLLDYVAKISGEDFESFKYTVAHRMSSKEVNPFDLRVPLNLDKQASHHLGRVSQEDMCSFIRERFVKNAPERRKLSIHIWGSSLEDQMETAYSDLSDDVEIFSDSDELKESLEYFPLPKGPFDNIG